jgi:hypothetical protein
LVFKRHHLRHCGECEEPADIVHCRLAFGKPFGSLDFDLAGMDKASGLQSARENFPMLNDSHAVFCEATGQNIP